ncbi:conserved hypothetical protein, partial [Parafrankia sp. EUN1f]
MAPDTSGGARPARRRRKRGLDLGDRGLRERASKKWGTLTGPSPVDRGKAGSKLHVLTDAAGLPLVVGVSGANLHDGHALIPLVTGI